MKQKTSFRKATGMVLTALSFWSCSAIAEVDATVMPAKDGVDSGLQREVLELVRPVSGIWWNPSAPGVGATLQVSRSGALFGTLYVYDEFGEPTFFTIQDESIEYMLERSLVGDEVSLTYARAISPLYRSEGGRCLGCEHSDVSTTEVPGAQVEIQFSNMEFATITISGDGYDYSEWIQFFAPGPVESTLPIDHTGSIQLLGNDYRSLNEVTFEDGGLGLYVTGHFGLNFSCTEPCDPIAQTIIERLEMLCIFFICGSGLTLFEEDANNHRAQYNEFQSTSQGLVVGYLDEKTAQELGVPSLIVIRRSPTVSDAGV